MGPSRALLQRAGRALALLSVGFVAWLLVQNRSAFAEVLETLTPTRLACAALALAAAHVLGGLVLAALCGGRAPLHAYLRVQWIAQIAKYAPGNVFHFVSRIAMARDVGTTERRLAELTLLEAVVTLVAGGLVCLLCLPFAAPALTQELLPRAPILERLIALGAGLVPLVLIALPAGERWRLRAVPPRTLGLALLAYGLCFVAHGIALLLVLPGADRAPWAPVLFASTVSWIAGFVVPGAPGGLGIRELVALALLAPLVEPGAIPFSLVALRLCSIAADLSMYALGLALPPGHREAPSP